MPARSGVISGSQSGRATYPLRHHRVAELLLREREIRRSFARVAIAAVSAACLIASALAAELTGAEIKELVSGKTVYLECGQTSTGGSGQGVIYYAADGTAVYKTAGRGVLSGTWAIKGNTGCTDWKQ